ncbi:MAG: DUF5110 domain-containing protein [Clostridia bacterium]|nr:DUF5110 domain-containing protein [Clostridia bacterium]
MKSYVEFPVKDGVLRLEAVYDGVVRCVQTLNAPPCPPSALIVPAPAPDFPFESKPDGIVSGVLSAAVSPDTGFITWSRTDTGETLLREAGHALTAQTVIRYTTGGEAPVVERVKTVDGERNFIKNLSPVADRVDCRAKLCFDFAPDEGVYGLGQGEEGVWNWRHQNQYLYQHNMRIPMPFFLSDRGYGVLVDCGSLMTFQDDINGCYLFLDAVPQLDYYVITGDSFDAVIAGLRRLTGRAALLPKWAFGYIQSKERYRTAAELSEVVRRYRALGVPLDGVVQDWHTWIEDHWGEKRVDRARYGDLRARMDDIHALHAHAMVSVWPNMNTGTADWEEFNRAGWLLNDLSTYDAFNPEARAMYWRQAKAELFDGGFDGWWCDSTEPFSGPDWNGEQKREPWERFALVGGEHKKFLDPEQANLYAVAHAKGIYENQRRDAPEKRVLNLTRSGYVSSQRYGAVLWSGDIAAKWSVMKSQIAEALNMAASGYPWWTLDIGGFFVVKENWRARGCGCGGDPSPKWFWQGDFENGIDDPGYRELYVRWLQFGCFLPMFRSHGTDTPREIWHFGKPGDPFYDAVAATIRLRYRLMPYIYAVAGRVWYGDGMMLRPLLFDFPKDARAVATATEYMFGPSILVCPVTEPMAYGPGGAALEREKRWTVYLPGGCDWVDFWDDARYHGGQEVTVDAPLDRVPLFVRAGAIIPMAEGLQYADQKPEGPMELRVYPGADADFDLYEDAGDGYGYERGEYTITRLHWDDAARTLSPVRGDMTVRIME